jgi:hypothetical protein
MSPLTGAKRRIHGAAFPTRNTPPSRADFLFLSQKAPKPGNILKIKGKTRHFSVPKAGNMLKIKPVICNTKKWILQDKGSIADLLNSNQKT